MEEGKRLSRGRRVWPLAAGVALAALVPRSHQRCAAAAGREGSGVDDASGTRGRG